MSWPRKIETSGSSIFQRAKEDIGRRPPRPLFVELRNAERSTVLFDLLFRWGALPAATRVHVAFEKLSGATPAVTARPEALWRYGIVVLRPRETPFPAERRGSDGRMRQFDLNRIYALSADRETLIPGIRVPPGRSLVVAVQVSLPADVTDGLLRFDVVQKTGKRVVGGSACFG